MRKVIGFITASPPLLFVISCGTPAVTEGFEKVSGIQVLSKINYNHLYGQLSSNEVGVAIIANNKQYTDIIAMKENDVLINILNRSSKYEFKNKYVSQSLGLFLGSFKIKNDHHTQGIYGKSKETLYGDHYPMIMWNHKVSEFGASNLVVRPGDIYEISYDF